MLLERSVLIPEPHGNDRIYLEWRYVLVDRESADQM
jgi:hypothetical protein